jgi:hypothetical protein
MSIHSSVASASLLTAALSLFASPLEAQAPLAYSSSAPAASTLGTDVVPGSDWNTNLNYDTSTWVKPGFLTHPFYVPPPPVEYVWLAPDGTPTCPGYGPDDIWLRDTFEAPPGYWSIILTGLVDDDVTVWLNGNAVVIDSDCHAADYAVALDVTAYVQPGTNLLALKVHNCNGCRGISYFVEAVNVHSGQANTVEASLFANGVGASVPGPFRQAVAAGSTLDLDWAGPAFMPYSLYTSSLSPSPLPISCIGMLDLQLPITLLYTGTTPFGGMLFSLDQNGFAQQSLTLPLGLTGLTFAVQGVIFQPPGAACVAVFTATHEVLID